MNLFGRNSPQRFIFGGKEFLERFGRGGKGAPGEYCGGGVVTGSYLPLEGESVPLNACSGWAVKFPPLSVLLWAESLIDSSLLWTVLSARGVVPLRPRQQ